MILKNKTLQTLAGANLFATLGISLFNIILLTYAKNFPHPHWFVSVVSIATILPNVFGSYTGRLADRTPQKQRWLITTKLVQAALYLCLAQIIDQQTVVVFYVVVGINVISDVLGNYGGNLLNVIIQKRVDSTQRQQVLGFNQSVGTLMEPLGQAIGVGLLAQTHNYALAGVFNALAFLLSALCLFVGRTTIQTSVTVNPKIDERRVWQTLRSVIEQTMGLSAFSFLGILMLLNISSMGFDGILNLVFLDQANQLPVPYAVAILLTNVTFVVGNVLGAMTKHTWFDHLNMVQLLTLSIVTTILDFSLLLVAPRLSLILGCVLITAFTDGKLNPVAFSLLMDGVDTSLTGTLLGTVSAIVTLATPVGSTGLMLLYNLSGANVAFSCAIAIAAGTLVWTRFAYHYTSTH
ncbi:MFS transporter [Lactiplantibacillus garii]|nr:MFS transporter [Lactiplantibacillus garii]